MAEDVEARESATTGIDVEKQEENSNGRSESLAPRSERAKTLREAARVASKEVQRRQKSVFQHCWDIEPEVKVSDEQTKFYKVDEVFKVAKFRKETVAKILQKQRRKDKKSNGCGRFWSRVKDHFRFGSTVRRIFIFPIFFLIGYYTIQVLYQLDMPQLCPNHIHLNFNVKKAGGEKSAKEAAKACRKQTESSFKRWNENSSLFLKLFTFLIGFYVSNIVSRWWAKVRSIPEVENPLLVLSGLVIPSGREDETGPNQMAQVDRLSLTSPCGITEIKKIIARYCLLSWTMCFNTFSQRLAEKFGKGEQLKERGLLTEEEFDCLRIAKLGPERKKIFSDLWWIPLAWAVNLINELGPYGDQIAIPKDHKDIITSLLRFKKALEDQKTQAENQLPLFYKRLIWWALMGWIVMSMFMLQQPNHYESNHSTLTLTLIANFPLTGVLMQFVLLGWLYMADILDNPFGFNLEHDLNLADILELNIWRCSVTIEQQSIVDKIGRGVAEDKREQMQKKLWNIIKPPPSQTEESSS